MYATSLHCFFCEADYPLTNLGSCPVCATPGEESALNETLGVKYDLARLKASLDREELAHRPAGLWRYHELLPVDDPVYRIDLGAGGTRLARLARLPESIAGYSLFMKVEGSNPSGSFKDRPIGVAASVALERGASGLACLTSGNIGSALAAVAARAGVPALVFLLGSAGMAGQNAAVSVEKYVQISAYGARVLTPVGDLGQLYALADRIEAELGWTFIHNLQAYQTDGDKTTAFEICEQLGWRAPAAVFVPTGTGTDLFGIWQGFALFKELGFIDRVPRMFAVQPAGAASLVVALAGEQQQSGPLIAPTPALPASITLGQHPIYRLPPVLEQLEPNVAPPISHRVSGYHAYKAIQVSGGGAVAVSDAQMLTAVKDLASYEGIYCEAASAAALAGIREAVALGQLHTEELREPGVVGILTSHGLKNSLALSVFFQPPPQVVGTWEGIAGLV